MSIPLKLTLHKRRFKEPYNPFVLPDHFTVYVNSGRVIEGLENLNVGEAYWCATKEAYRHWVLLKPDRLFPIKSFYHLHAIDSLGKELVSEFDDFDLMLGYALLKYE